MIPEEINNKLFKDYMLTYIIPFLLYFYNSVPENEFKSNFCSLFEKYKLEIDQRINAIFPNFEYDKNLIHIGEQIFSIEVKAKNMDNFYKIQFYGMNIVIQKYFDELLYFISDIGFYKDEKFNGMIEYFKYLIIDSLVLVSDCELEHGIESSRKMAKQNILQSVESYKSSVNLKLNLFAYSSLSSFNASVFLIRQSIELKIKNALGINYIADNKGAMLRIPGDKFMDFFFNNSKIELPDIKKSIVRKIHNWTQYFVHGGYILNLWQIDIAHSLLRPLFDIGEKNGALSLYGGVRISKKYFDTNYKTDLENFVQNIFFGKKKKNVLSIIKKYLFCKNSKNSSFKIIYMAPEALLY
jgi:hypothetical protein